MNLDLGSPSAGALGGAAGEHGAEFRRGVAAYFAALGLTGTRIAGLALPVAQAEVAQIALETDSEVDDINVLFTSGCTAFIQAKRTLDLGRPLKEAVRQWEAMGSGPLDPDKHRLVIVAARLSGPVRVLRDLLERHKRAEPGSLTGEERRVLNKVLALLTRLSPEQQERVLRAAVIRELDVTGPDSPGTSEATSALDRVLAPSSSIDPHTAWTLLCGEAGTLARQRSGEDIAGWARHLRTHGATFSTSIDSPAASAVALEEALSRYKGRLMHQGGVIDVRGLGAPVSPLERVTADAGIRVHAEDVAAEDRYGRELLWAFMRRGRVVLTGLPGAGKSTSIRSLASDLCTTSGAPVPVRVSLKDVDRLHPTLSMRDRILRVAIAEERPNDQPLLLAELNRLLDRGGVALLLDSLDETYERRGSVVKDLDELVRTASPDVDVLLATRDVAYAHAQTLGWKTLRQGKPQDPDRVVAALLSEQDGPQNGAKGARTGRSSDAGGGGADRAQSILNKQQWVLAAVASNPTLQETPIMPVLLALLARGRDEECLPSTRAATLVAVVKDVIERFELTRRPDTPLANMTPNLVADGLLHAYAAEAALILDHKGAAPIDAARNAIAKEAAAFWGLSSGHARTFARDAIHFFDESGIFVLDSNQTIEPRVALFAEIGAALYAIEHNRDHLIDWASDQVAAGQHEPLILASVLDPLAADAVGAVVSRSSDAALLVAAVRAYCEGAQFGTKHIEGIQRNLIAAFVGDTYETWDLLAQVLKLPLTEALREPLLSAASRYDTERQVVVEGALALRLRSVDENRADPSPLRHLLRLGSLPRLQGTSGDERKPVPLRYLRGESVLLGLQSSAADVLVGFDKIGTDAAARLAGVQARSHDVFRELLTERGVSFRLPTEEPPADPSSWMRALPIDSYRTMLDAIAGMDDAEHETLGHSKRTRLEELSSFLETLAMNETDNRHMLSEPLLIPRIIELFAHLYSFDIPTLAAQAKLTCARIAELGGDSTPYWALFDDAVPRPEADVVWTDVADIAGSMEVLREMMHWGVEHAWVAATPLWAAVPAPVHDLAVPMLRELLPPFERFPEHYRVVAHTLNALNAGDEADAFAASDLAVARVVAAECVVLDESGGLSRTHAELLADSDGHVREAALTSAVRLDAPELRQLLMDAAAEPDPGWRCRACGADNPLFTPNRPRDWKRSSTKVGDGGDGEICAAPECDRKGPSPQDHARKLLKQLDSAS